jgi:hypothetical protein
MIAFTVACFIRRTGVGFPCGIEEVILGGILVEKNGLARNGNQPFWII